MKRSNVVMGLACALAIIMGVFAMSQDKKDSQEKAKEVTTASGLIFSGDAEGTLLALDSRSGKLLWRYQMGAPLHGTSPITYMLDGRQHVLVPAGTTLMDWALPN